MYDPVIIRKIGFVESLNALKKEVNEETYNTILNAYETGMYNGKKVEPSEIENKVLGFVERLNTAPEPDFVSFEQCRKDELNAICRGISMNSKDFCEIVNKKLEER